jgi:glutathionyl-hydroquinone reductase
MGKFKDGVWQPGWYDAHESGEFQRPEAGFRQHVSADRAAPFAAESGRYHLYAAYACPWAQRSLITRALRGLENAIPVTIVQPKMGDDGWEFGEDDPEPLFGAKYLRDIYLQARPSYSGRVTVPVLWDKQTRTIVNNESRDVMRMLDTAFDAFAKNPVTLAPPELVPRIDKVLDSIYSPINNGVYRAGFATKQEAYNRACAELFSALDHWDEVLGKQRYTCGRQFTEADVALFTTLFRFDLVYHTHFKCNVRRLRDYNNLWGFVRDVYQMPAVKATCRPDHIKLHYYWSQENVNPHRIVAMGPDIDFDTPHDRGAMR